MFHHLSLSDPRPGLPDSPQDLNFHFLLKYHLTATPLPTPEELQSDTALSETPCSDSAAGTSPRVYGALHGGSCSAGVSRTSASLTLRMHFKVKEIGFLKQELWIKV